MRDVQGASICKYFLCFRCDDQFYCSVDDRRPACPMCGSYDEEHVIAIEPEDDELLFEER